ncbi:hypothetical protein CMI37_18055 [Candidatus Pacearchaeota archaeon]|nr:hypothetical protein [Candidatus Pacearchaeota archaeon]
MKRIYYRCSSLKGVLACSSYGMTDNPWNPETPYSQQGSAAHLGIQYYIDSKGQIPDFPEVQLKFPLSEIEDLQICFWMAKKLWDENLAPFMGDNVETEVAMQAKLGVVEIDGEEHEVWLTGHADVVARTSQDLMVWDWKFGRAPGTSYFAQTAGYAALAVATYGWPESGQVTVGEAHPRFGKWKDHTQKIDKVYLGQFKKTILAAAEMQGKTKSPSPDACKFCSARLDCSEYPRMFKESFIAVKSIVEGDPEIVDPEELAQLHSAYKTIEYACSSFKKLFSSSLETAGAYGKDKAVGEFYLKEVTRRAVDARAAWPQLTKVLSQGEIASILSLSLSKVKKAVMDKTPPGMKKNEYWGEFEKALYEAAAVHEGTSHQVTKV